MIKRIAIALVLVCMASAAGLTSTINYQNRTADENLQRSAARDRATDGEAEEDCQRLYDNSHFDQPYKLIAEEKQTLSRSSINGINVEGSMNGGVSIRGW